MRARSSALAQRLRGISGVFASSMRAGRLMPHTFCKAAPEGRLGVRQLAAAFAFSLAILAHPKAQASLRTPRASHPIKKYAALGGTPALRQVASQRSESLVIVFPTIAGLDSFQAKNQLMPSLDGRWTTERHVHRPSSITGCFASPPRSPFHRCSTRSSSHRGICEIRLQSCGCCLFQS
jgi:hypothetical protein